MKALLIGAMIALASTPAIADPRSQTIELHRPAAQSNEDTAAITAEEIDARAKICIGIVSGKVTPQQVTEALNLDTDRKQRDFVVGCLMFIRGVELGKKMGYSS